jgi:acyl dehydratase
MYFEEFNVGDKFSSGGVTFTESEIVRFALQYDPQPFHIDVEAANNSPFKGLIASGFQTLALVFRMYIQEGMLKQGMGSPGMDELRWLLPVRPGDTLHMEVEVLGTKASSSRSDRGYVEKLCTVVNQRSEKVMTVRVTQIIRRRESD